MAGNSIKTSIHSFIIPYFIQTDPKGITYAVCDKMDALLSLPGKPDNIGQPLSTIFTHLSHNQLLLSRYGKVNMVTAPEKRCTLSVHLPINYLKKRAYEQ
jgi:hypothetical protein